MSLKNLSVDISEFDDLFVNDYFQTQNFDLNHACLHKI